MKSNMGSVDKIIRLLLAVIFIAIYFTETVKGTFSVALLVMAGIFILTSIVSFCPLYVPLGLNTCKKKK